VLGLEVPTLLVRWPSWHGQARFSCLFCDPCPLRFTELDSIGHLLRRGAAKIERVDRSDQYREPGEDRSTERLNIRPSRALEFLPQPGAREQEGHENEIDDGCGGGDRRPHSLGSVVAVVAGERDDSEQAESRTDVEGEWDRPG
jgi:hypothetical protein